MGSTLALWAYHRRLSLDAQRIKNQESTRRESLANPGVSNYSGRTTGRTESECSTASQPPPATERKVSWKVENSSSDSEDDGEEQIVQPNKSEAPTPKRRFSFDFLFSRNKKNKKAGRKQRSQSVAVGHDDVEVREHKYPGIHNADFAALYFF